MFAVVYFFGASNVGSQNILRTADTLAANNIKMWVINDGRESYNPVIDSAGFYWPNEGNRKKHAIYLSGIQIGGLINKRYSIGGMNYTASTYKPGMLGASDAENDSLGRIWRIKKGWEDEPDLSEREYLKYNYENWPGNYGAPYKDIDGDGTFTKGIDEPDFIGGEVIFYMMYNALNTARLFEDDTLHAAIQFNVTLWASDSSEDVKDAVFERIELINKDTVTLKDFYAAYWVDADLGYPMDDYVGCAPHLYLAYCWNTFIDDPFYGEIAPSVGHAVLSGFHNDGNNLMMSAFGPNFKISSTSFDPRNAEEHYNVVRGLLTVGDPFIDPYTKKETPFPLSGNPEDSTGWYEGGDWPAGETFGEHPPYPGDRRYYIVTGPVNFAPGDTQSITFAHIMALGESNTNSIAVLKQKALQIHRLFGNDFINGTDESFKTPPPNEFALYQNYPNPFNPATTIKFSIPDNSIGTRYASSLQNVTLKVYDVLGRAVATLVNEKLSSGTYEANFEARNLASGIYIYKITAGKFSKARKMILLK